MKDKTILLVEDNPNDEKLTLRALKKHHIKHKVIVAHNGAEALDYIFGTGLYMGRDVTEMPAVVLLDLNLPRADGFEVLRQIRAKEQTQFLPVVILTSSKTEEDLVAGYGLGANSYVRKPVDFNDFSEVIRELGLYWLLFNETPPVVKVSND